MPCRGKPPLVHWAGFIRRRAIRSRLSYLSEVPLVQPSTYSAALACMVGSMLCWGSWANTKKLAAHVAFPLFYWDYCLGLLLASVFFGLSFGTFGATGTSFVQQITGTDLFHLLLALAGGCIFNIANLLLVAAIEVAGMAVAFPVGIGLALVIGAALSYLVTPQGSPVLLCLGIALVVGAIVLDAMAYRRREAGSPVVLGRGLRLALLSGVLMGLFYPLVARSLTGPHALGAYSVNFIFTLGVLLSAVVVNSLLMRRPLTGEAPSSFAQYGRLSLREHLWGVLGGFVWSTGAILSFVTAATHLVGPAVSYAIGQGATMVSAFWGVFIWREFAAAPVAARRLLLPMFLLFLAGLAAIAYAPLVHL